MASVMVISGGGRIGTDGPDERLEFRVGEEPLELLGGFPLVDDDDEAVTDSEPVMQPALGPRHVADLRELASPVGESLPELGHVTLELPGD
jgi:hypothetical protein